CCTVAAEITALRTTPLHPLGSLDDHLDQLEDAAIEVLIVDAENFALRGEEIAARITGVHIFGIGRANFGPDIVALVAAEGSATPRWLANPEDPCTLIYTGGTTGRSKGVLRRHSSWTAVATAVLSDFELPDTPRYLLVAPMGHVAGTKILPTLIKGG